MLPKKFKGKKQTFAKHLRHPLRFVFCLSSYPIPSNPFPTRPISCTSFRYVPAFSLVPHPIPLNPMAFHPIAPYFIKSRRCVISLRKRIAEKKRTGGRSWGVWKKIISILSLLNPPASATPPVKRLKQNRAKVGNLERVPLSARLHPFQKSHLFGPVSSLRFFASRVRMCRLSWRESTPYSLRIFVNALPKKKKCTGGRSWGVWKKITSILFLLNPPALLLWLLCVR